MEKMKLWDGMKDEAEPSHSISPVSPKMEHPEIVTPADTDDRGENEEGENEEDDDGSDDEPESNSLDIEAYKDLLKSSTSYPKLLSDVHRECTLVPTHPNTVERIATEIHAILPVSNRVSRSRPSERFTMDFDVHWDPLDILSKVESSGPSKLGIGSLVVLVGSPGMAQALTCAEYLTQTWPTTGPCILELIGKSIVADRSNRRQSCKYHCFQFHCSD